MMSKELFAWLTPSVDDPDLARQQRLLNLTLLALAGPGFLFGLVMTGMWALGQTPITGALAGLGVQPFYLAAYWLGRRGRVRLAGYLPTIIVFLVMAGVNYQIGVGHAILIGYAMVTLTAGFLIGTGAALFFALLSMGTCLAVGAAQTAGRVPTPLPPETTVVADSIAVGLGLIVLVIFNWFSNHEASRMLQRERELGVELRAHHEELERRVVERTAELTSVNEQLENRIADRKRAEKALEETVSLLQATLESTADGILVVDAEGKIASFNQRFAEMWHIPNSIIEPRDDDRALKYVLDQLADPDAFLKKVRELYDQPDAESFDVLEFKDGRIFERYSQPQRIRGKSGGRVWSFRDVTQRMRVEEEARRRASQATLIYKVGQRVSGELELDTLLSEIVVAVQDAFGYYGVMLLLLDEKNERLTLQSIAGGYSDVFPADLSLALGEGMIGHTAATGETQVSGDVSQNPHYVRKAQETTRSELAVPVRSGDRIIGVLDLQSEELDTFDELDVIAMETLSSQIGAAIENARLLQDTRVRAGELDVLNDLGQALTARLDVDHVLEETYRGVSRLMDTTDFYIVLYQPDEEEITFALDVIEGEMQKPYVTRQAGRGLAECVIYTRAPLLIEENLPQALEEMGIELGRRPALSWVGVPLIVGDRVLGMMAAVQSRADSPAYDEHDRDLLHAVASQTAIALQNARLFEETRRRVNQLTLINDIAEKIAAVLDLESVLKRAARLVQEGFGYHHVGLFALDRERGELVMRARAGDFVHLFPSDHRLKLGQGMVGWVGRHNETLLANDVEAEPRYVNLYPGVVPTRSELCAPIGVGGEVAGVLDVQSPQRDAFDENDVLVLETLADQIAVAIENARLYEAVQQELAERKQAQEALRRRNRELATLYEATASISSDLSLEAVLQAVAEKMTRALGSSGCALSLWDRERGVIETLIDFDVLYAGDTVSPGTTYSLYDYPATCAVLETGQPVIVQRDDPVADGAELALMQDEGVYTLLMVPLIARDRVLGLAELVHEVERRDYTPDQLRLAQSLAAQAAIAIENARLHEEVLDHAERLEQRVQERTAQLAAERARLEATLHSASDGIVVTDGAGDIVQANPVAQAWLTQTLAPDEATRLREAVRSVAARAEERPMELLELAGLDLEVKAAPISETGSEAAAVIAIHDVSHLKSLDRMKNRFVTNISHELRTPITTIKLYTHLMQQRTDKWEQYLETLAQEADHQARLVEDILEISRLDSGRSEMRPRPTPLDELTGAVVSSHRQQAQERGLALEYRAAEPGPVALIDPDRMMQALSNLVKNGIRHTPAGGRVALSTAKKEADGRAWATVTVADTGMGIPGDELPHIFERFFRGQRPRDMQLSGTGLGLSIVKEIVELHGGWVAVESEESVGSTFVVWLPLAE